MSSSRKFVLCQLDELRFALELSAIDRVVHAVEITSVPEAPPVILGVIKVKDRVIPVINTRKRFGLPEREIELNDQIVIAHVSRGPVALLVDEVAGLIECDEKAFVPSTEILGDMSQIEGVAMTDSGIVVIEDLEKFLSANDAARLHEALAAHA